MCGFPEFALGQCEFLDFGLSWFGCWKLRCSRCYIVVIVCCLSCVFVSKFGRSYPLRCGTRGMGSLTTQKYWVSASISTVEESRGIFIGGGATWLASVGLTPETLPFGRLSFSSRSRISIPRHAMLARRYMLSSCVCRSSVSLSVRPSVTRRYCTKTGKPMITPMTPYEGL